MSRFDDAFDTAADVLFAEFGEQATVQHGADPAVPVRVVLTRGVERLGDYGQVVARITTADFLVAEWQPQQGDLVVWTDRFGANSHKVESIQSDDGLVAVAVLHG